MVFSINIIRRRAVLLRLQIIVNLFGAICVRNTEYLQPYNEMNPNKSGKKSDYVGTISGFLLSDPRLSGKKSDCIGTISGF